MTAITIARSRICKVDGIVYRILAFLWLLSSNHLILHKQYIVDFAKYELIHDCGSLQQKDKLPLSSRSCVMLDAVRRARLKQLRGPRSQAPKVQKASHVCLQCQTTYKDCDALIMHRLRHIEGKHWPCPVSPGFHIPYQS